MSVDKLQEAEEQVAQMREQAARDEQDALREDLRRPPLDETAAKAHRPITAPLAHVRTMTNMRTGPLEDIHELAVSIRETGLLHPPLVRETGEEEQPYELLAGQRRFAAMKLLDDADEAVDWRFTVVDGVSTREALTMQFAENFHQSKPEPVQFARAVRLIMKEDESLTAAEVSRIVGAPVDWTRKSLKLLELPEGILARVERGDLSFTTADFVRRQVARGAVTEQKAQELVEAHAEGGLSSTELKFGAGYVPPPPEGLRGDLRPAGRRAARSRPSPRRARSATRTGRTPRRARPSRRRRCTTGWATPRSTRSCSARSCTIPRRRARRSCCGSRARPTRTSTRARCARTSGCPLCAPSPGKP